MSDLVGNPEDRFSRVAAHTVPGQASQRLVTSMSHPSVIHHFQRSFLKWPVKKMSLDRGNKSLFMKLDHMMIHKQAIFKWLQMYLMYLI